MLSNTCFAQPRNEHDAISVAQDFWNNKQNKLSVVAHNDITKAKTYIPHFTASRPAYYIVNDEESRRFVIVSGDERLYNILGYSDNGVFNAETAPYGLLEMLSGYDSQYQKLAPHLDKISHANTRNTTIVVDPLIRTKWGQSEPFNNECPTNPNSDSENRCLAGCGATGMAQIMNYYKYPDCGIGSHSYTTEELKIYQHMDFATMYPDWNNMADTYYGRTTDTQKEAVAQLMHACGVSLTTQYNTESGSTLTDLTYSLSHFWKYNANISCKIKKYYNDKEWHSIIMQDLIEGHPILYCGSGKSGAHLFILDGCDGDGLYHFNFGWSGSGDGYYSLDLISPVGLSFFGGLQTIGDYSDNQAMACYITPETFGQKECDFYASDFSLPNNSKLGDSIIITTNLYNGYTGCCHNIPESPEFVGNFGLGIFDQNFNFITSITSYNVSLYSAYGIAVQDTLCIDDKIFKNGEQYYIAYFAHSKDLGYTLFRTKKGQTNFYLTTIIGDSVVFEPMKEITSSKTAVFIENNIAGELELQISDRQKNNAKKWYISGEVNGTDIRFLKEVFSLGIITDLDIIDATIVNGGSAYYKTYTTENDVIGRAMFMGAKSLKTLQLPKTAKKIESESLDSCVGLKKITIPDNVTEVSNINHCTNLREIHIGANVKKIETSFSGDSLLNSFTVSEQNKYFTTIDRILYSKSKTCVIRCPIALKADKLTLGNDVVLIEEHAFRDCERIKKINLPEGVRVIDAGAFMNSGLENINLPASITKIARFAFWGCKKLRHVESHIEEYLNTILHKSTFNGCNNDCIWHVPKGTANMYLNADWWKPTWEIIDDSTTGIKKTQQDEKLTFIIGSGSLTIKSDLNKIVTIYDIKGNVVKQVHVISHRPETMNLPDGIYIVNGCKYRIR